MNATFQHWAKVANFPISEKFPTFAKTRYPQAYHEGESGKSHTDRDRHADAGLAGCSPSPPPSRIQHLLRDVAGMRPMRRSDARTQSGRRPTPFRFSSCRAGTISRISNRFRLSLPTLSQLPSSVHSPVRRIGPRLSYPPFTEPFVSHGNGHSLSFRAPPVFPA